MINELPIGFFLVLGVTGDPPFICRPIVGAPKPDRVVELLLDGQQRLTALWRSLNDNYQDVTYFVHIPKEALEDDARLNELEFVVEAQSIWYRGGKRYPLWVNTPRECWDRNLIPVKLLNPDLPDEADKWAKEAKKDDKDYITLIKLILYLRSRVANYVIPYLFLEPTTPRDVAIDVFIKLNTSYVKLTPYDIAVAQMEEVVGTSLHDMVGQLKSIYPGIQRYLSEISDIILPVAALLQDKVPTHSNFLRLDLKRLHDDWSKIINGVGRTVDFLVEEYVYDEQRLPTTAILAPLIALWSAVSEDPVEIGNARILLRKYIWRAFFTNRYDRSVNTAIYQDYEELKVALFENDDEVNVPCLNEESHPLPRTPNDLINARWPKYRDRLSRAILLLSLRGGAEDIADGAIISVENIVRREYHHIYPVSWFLGKSENTDDAHRALNCILIASRTNKAVSAKSPLEYLKELCVASSLGENEIRRRLRSHFIDYDLLVKENYEEFILKRAEASIPAIKALCNGEVWRP